jgi:hypothetical protein
MSNYPIKQLVLSHSSLSTIDSCERKFEFSKMFGDAEEREEMFAAEVGKALHTGAQDYFIHKDYKKAAYEFLLSYPHELEFVKDENHRNRGLEASYATLMVILQSPIFDRYELVYLDSRFGDRRPCIEVSFAITILNSPFPLPVYFVGFIDAILFDRVEQRYIVVDIKTHRNHLNDLSAMYEFDQQTIPYGIVLEHILGRKIDEFEVAYLSAYIDLENPKLMMYKFVKTQDDVHAWYMLLCETITKIAHNYKREFFHRTTSGRTCMSFNRACWFYEQCGYRDVKLVAKMMNTTVRETLFHSGEEAWIEAEIEWVKT